MRTRIAVFVTVIQTILLLAHGFVYETCAFFGLTAWTGITPLRTALLIASLSFVPITFIAFRSSHPLVRLFYTLVAVWLGLLDFFFLASLSCWVAFLVSRASGWQIARPAIAAVMFGSAILVGVYGIINAARPRVHRVTVKLPGLPQPWRGRVAALLSDTHLGHVRGLRFITRVAATLRTLQPDIILFPGDMFDGTKVDATRLAAEWKGVTPPFGFYFVTGNHEEFFNPGSFVDGLKRAGVRVLRNEKTVVDGLQIVGVAYLDSTHAAHYSSVLDRIEIDREAASILLAHVPHHLDVAERHGISLQVSGHTHGGQLFPFTLFVLRIFGKYARGLQRFGAMSVFTTVGTGTWGPPLRVGTRPEIILLRFE